MARLQQPLLSPARGPPAALSPHPCQFAPSRVLPRVWPHQALRLSQHPPESSVKLITPSFKSRPKNRGGILCPQFSLLVLASCFAPLAIPFFRVIFCAPCVVSWTPMRPGQQVTMPEEQQGVQPGFTWGNSPETRGATPDGWGGTSQDLPPNARGTKL